MKNLKSKIKNINGITLISLVITIIVLIILAGVTLNMLLGENGILNRTKTAKEQNDKATATETTNLKITNVQMSKYAEEQRMPTLKELADNFCEDNDFQYVQETSEVASLTPITNNNPTSIYTKLKAYPYEFEINSSLQLASIDGVKIASNDTTEYVSQSQYNSLLARVVALENNSSSQSSSSSTSIHYSTDEQIVGTWIDGKTLYQKTLTGTTKASGDTITQITDEPLSMCTVISGGISINGDLRGMMGYPGQDCEFWVGEMNSKPNLYIYLQNNSTLGNKPFIITVQYTKTNSSPTE